MPERRNSVKHASFILSERPAGRLAGRLRGALAPVLLATLLLGGCALPGPSPGSTPGESPGGASGAAGTPAAAGPVPEPAPPRRALDDADRAEIRRLLQTAEYALTDGQAVDPPGRSALHYYDRVLAMDPDNPEARHGIEAVIERLVAEARRAAAGRRFDEAARILARAYLVDDGHPAIRPALTEIRLLESARRSVYRLDPRDLDTRSAAVLATLREAGRASRAPGCRAIIRARNDAEGRWIYQEMSAAPGRDRIRAELQTASAPNIENICFQGAEP